MSYATWSALRNSAKDGQQMNGKRRIGFGEQDRMNDYDGEGGSEMRMPHKSGGEMGGYESPTNKRRYRRYENGRFKPHKSSMSGDYMADNYVGYDEYDMEDDEEHHPQERKNAKIGGSLWMEPKEDGAIEPLKKEKAKEWVESMTPPDPSNKQNGGKFTWEEVRAIASRHGISEERKLVELYAMANAMKSDYFKVAQKYGVGSPEFFYDLAKAFIDDDDAKLHKVARYYKYIAAR